MTIRAKCRLCSTVMPLSEDIGITLCVCGGVGIGKDKEGKLIVYAQDYSNLFRVDEEGKEYPTKVLKESEDASIQERSHVEAKDFLGDESGSGSEKSGTDTDLSKADLPKPTLDRQELLIMIDDMIKRVDDMPSHAKTLPITHLDYQSVLIMMKAMFTCP